MPAAVTHFQQRTKNNRKTATTETELDILNEGIHNKIDRETGNTGDNNQDKTNAQPRLHGIEQARQQNHTLRHLQLLHQNR
nr:DUF957 domain-containing protein [Escherichia coli]